MGAYRYILFVMDVSEILGFLFVFFSYSKVEKIKSKNARKTDSRSELETKKWEQVDMWRRDDWHAVAVVASSPLATALYR